MDDIIEVSGPLMPGTGDTPLDPRSRAETLAAVPAVGNPFRGLIFYVVAEGRAYLTTTLTAKQSGAILLEDGQIGDYVGLATLRDLQGYAALVNGKIPADCLPESSGGGTEIAESRLPPDPASIPETRANHPLIWRPAAKDVKKVTVYAKDGEIVANVPIAAFGGLRASTAADELGPGYLYCEGGGNQNRIEVELPEPLGESDFTVKCRVYIVPDHGHGLQTIFTTGAQADGGAGDAPHLWFGLHDNGLRPMLGGYPTYHAKTADDCGAVGQWMELVMQRKGTAATAYLDGKCVLTTTLTGALTQPKISLGASAQNGDWVEYTYIDRFELVYEALYDGDYDPDDADAGDPEAAFDGPEAGYRVSRQAAILSDSKLLAPAVTKDDVGKVLTAVLEGKKTQKAWCAPEHRAKTATIDVTYNSEITLDASEFERWVLTGSGEIYSVSLVNWQDGDRGELVVDTSQISLEIPGDWQTTGADITTTQGAYVLEIVRENAEVFCSIKYPYPTPSAGSAIGTVVAGEVADGAYVADYDSGDVHMITSPSSSYTLAAANVPVGAALVMRVANANGGTVVFDGNTIIEAVEVATFMLTFANISGSTRLYSKVLER